MSFGITNPLLKVPIAHPHQLKYFFEYLFSELPIPIKKKMSCKPDGQPGWFNITYESVQTSGKWIITNQ
jgi:hypothetical protein